MATRNAKKTQNISEKAKKLISINRSLVTSTSQPSPGYITLLIDIGGLQPHNMSLRVPGEWTVLQLTEHVNSRLVHPLSPEDFTFSCRGRALRKPQLRLSEAGLGTLSSLSIMTQGALRGGSRNGSHYGQRNGSVNGSRNGSFNGSNHASQEEYPAEKSAFSPPPNNRAPQFFPAGSKESDDDKDKEGDETIDVLIYDMRGHMKIIQ